MALRLCRRLLQAVEAVKKEADSENDEKGPFTMADEDSIMKHMMDCLSLLADIQREERQQQHAKSRIVRNKVFVGVL